MKKTSNILFESSIIIVIITALMYIMVIAYNDGFYSFYEISSIKYEIYTQDIVNIVKPIVFHIFIYVSLCSSVLLFLL